jgi:hypothetical protein
MLAAAREIRPSRGAHNPGALDTHYKTVRTAIYGVFKNWGWPHELRQLFLQDSPLSA